MTATYTETPQLRQLGEQISKAFQGGPGPAKDFQVTTINSDATQLAAQLLSAYQAAALANPAKAFKTKGMTPPLSLDRPQDIADKAWWNDVLRVVADVAPVVINALSKDFEPKPKQLSDIIAALPAARKNDKAWTDYATQSLLYGSYWTTQCFGGNAPSVFPDPPQPPPGQDKGWFDDVCSFVADAAPVVLPIVMSLI